MPFKFYDVDACARDLLQGVAKNRGEIVITPHAKVASRAQRWLPGLVDRMAAKQMGKLRAHKLPGG